MRRLDGYYHNPTAEAVLAALKATNREIVPLQEVTEKIFGVPRFRHIYSEAGIPYIDSEDLFKLHTTVPRVSSRR